MLVQQVLYYTFSLFTQPRIFFLFAPYQPVSRLFPNVETGRETGGPKIISNSNSRSTGPRTSVHLGLAWELKNSSVRNDQKQNTDGRIPQEKGKGIPEVIANLDWQGVYLRHLQLPLELASTWSWRKYCQRNAITNNTNGEITVLSFVRFFHRGKNKPNSVGIFFHFSINANTRDDYKLQLNK